MGKLTKVRNRSKMKSKKPTTKTKSKSSSSKKIKQISGAPKNSIDDNNMSDNESTTSQSTIALATFRLNRRIMKSHHIEDEEKAIRKAQRSLNKAKKSNNEDEIKDAQSMLEEAIAEKEDAAKWTHPEDTIDKLSRILNEQISNGDETELIEMTQDLILDAEDSLRMINQGQEEAIFYQLTETDESPKDFDLSDSLIQELSYLDKGNSNMLPPIGHQSTFEESSNLFSQAINEQDLVFYGIIKT